jgi:effector-binding domain-containing protein
VIRKVLYVVVALVAVLAGIGMLLPRTVHLERSAVVDRPPSVVFATVNSYRRFDEWSPWNALDPNLNASRSGPDVGVGAHYSWTGNSKVGTGSQTITASVPYERVSTDLDFGMDGPAKAAFLLKPEGAGTRLTWTLDADMGAGPIGRWFGLFMERMVGPDYEQGLAAIKTVAEKLPATDLAGFTAERVNVPKQTLLVVAMSSRPEPAAIADAYARAYGAIGKVMGKAGASMTGPPIGIETKVTKDEYVFDAAIPVDRAVENPPAPIVVRDGYTGPALKAVHVGSYDTMDRTAAQLGAWAAAYGYRITGPVWASYVDDPQKVAPAQVRTELYAPITE